jgi:hypothetical protein
MVSIFKNVNYFLRLSITLRLHRATIEITPELSWDPTRTMLGLDQDTIGTWSKPRQDPLGLNRDINVGT